MREPTEFLEQFGERVREYREHRRLSLSELAERLDMSKTGLWQIERGVSVAGVNTLLRLCLALNVSPNRLLLGREAFLE